MILVMKMEIILTMGILVDKYIIVTTLWDKEKIENKIKKIHDYEVPEISFYSISNVNTEFFNWIDEYTSKMASNCFIITR